MEMSFHSFKNMILFAVLVFASMNVGAKDQVLKRSEELLNEERRQQNVNRRMDTMIRKCDWLLEDIESNKLSEKAKMILDAIYNHDKRRLNMSEILHEVGFEEAELEEFIQDLENRRLIDPKVDSHGKTWRIRTAGKAIVGMDHLTQR